MTLHKFEKFQSNEFGIFYIRPVFPQGHRLEWLNHYKLKNIPHESRFKIKDLASVINKRNDIIVKMDSDIIHPGCVAKSESIEEISNQVYSEFCNILGKENVRMVWGIGEMDQTELNSIDSLHRVSEYSPILLKVGKYLDESDECGIFKVDL
jgi:hypothetical protein